jgi:hypothetical protein
MFSDSVHFHEAFLNFVLMLIELNQFIENSYLAFYKESMDFVPYLPVLELELKVFCLGAISEASMDNG